MSNTKAELEAENARLRDENEALLGLLAVIAHTDPPVPDSPADMDKFYRTARDWGMGSAHTAAALLPYAGDKYFAAVVRGAARQLGKDVAGPLPYAVSAPEPEPVLEGTVTGRPIDAPYAEVIPARPPLCDATLPLRNGSELKCTRDDGHYGAHSALAGKERWLGTGADARADDGTRVAPEASRA